VLHQTRPWLDPVPWKTVIEINEKLTQSVSGTDPASAQPLRAPQKQGFEPARKLWEEAVTRPMKLIEALELCRTCVGLTPFLLSAETFSQVTTTLAQDLIERLSGVEQQIFRNTLHNYVTDQISRKELDRVLAFVESRWSHSRAADLAPAPVTATQPQPLAS
jgi:hypothetical protein